jgi:hypothetical protein
VSEPSEAPTAARTTGPGDDEFIEGYAKGYADGLREALRELRAHAGRGASPQELRMLIESRLARVPEDVAVKKKGLLRPPARAPWASLLRPPAAPAWSPPRSSLPVAPAVPGSTHLFREERPKGAVELLRASAPRFRQVVLVSQRAPDLPGIAPEHVDWIVPAGSRAESSGSPGALDPSAFAGRIRAAVDVGSVLVYLDAIEFLSTEYPVDFTLRVVLWVAQDAARNGSAVIASVSPGALEPRDVSRLERAFQTVS